MTIRRRVFAALICSAATCVASTPPSRAQSSDSTEAVSKTRRTAIVRAVETVAPAVVTVAAQEMRYVREVVPLFDFDTWFPFEMPGMTQLRARPVSSLSSGVVFSEDGLIVTNEHGVPEGARLTVTLPDGRLAQADQVEVVGKDYASDIAVLRVRLPDMPAARFGSSADLAIGEWVIAIGNPFGYVIGDPQPSVSVGVVSALNRCFSGPGGDKRIYRDMIQTDASINQGNSGGPLVNADGQVVGINTFILSKTGGSIGIGFAIPIDRARRVIDEIISYGRIRPIDLGFSVGSVDPGVAGMLGLKRSAGVVIVELAHRGAAARAGLEVGDLIYEVNGRPINDLDDARMAFRSLLVGDRVEIKLERAGTELELSFDIVELK